MERAYVMINCEMGSEGNVIEQLKPVTCVKDIRGVYGNYDILVELEGQSIDEISHTISSKIRKLEKVRSTTTIVCVN
ncbi:MAG: Lrp/AsnC ligand binding domain-containing protein [Nitrososphaera sp.]